MVCVVNVTPRPPYPPEILGTHCIGRWLGPRAVLNGCGKTRHHPHAYMNTHINNAITNRILQQHLFTRYNSKYIRLHPTNAYRPSTGTLYFPLSVPDSGDRFRRHKINKLSVTINSSKAVKIRFSFNNFPNPNYWSF